MTTDDKTYTDWQTGDWLRDPRSGRAVLIKEAIPAKWPEKHRVKFAMENNIVMGGEWYTSRHLWEQGFRRADGDSIDARDLPRNEIAFGADWYTSCGLQPYQKVTQ